jgi:hypothetical protein
MEMSALRRFVTVGIRGMFLSIPCFTDSPTTILPTCQLQLSATDDRRQGNVTKSDTMVEPIRISLCVTASQNGVKHWFLKF